MAVEIEQLAVCEKYGVIPFSTTSDLKIGISQSALAGALPLNGLRHVPEGTASGWYLWGGEEFSYDEKFFSPFHIHHLPALLPAVVKYLLLPPGWRFLLMPPSYADVWQDDTLL